MGFLTDGLPPAVNGTDERLDRVLLGLELLAARQGLQPEGAPVDGEVRRLSEPNASPRPDNAGITRRAMRRRR